MKYNKIYYVPSNTNSNICYKKKNHLLYIYLLLLLLLSPVFLPFLSFLFILLPHLFGS